MLYHVIIWLNCKQITGPVNTHHCFSWYTEVWHIPTRTDPTEWSNGPDPGPDPQGHCLTVWGCCCMGLAPGCTRYWSRCRSRPAGRPQQLYWWCCRWDCRWKQCCASQTGLGSWWHQLCANKQVRKDNYLFSTLMSFHQTLNLWMLLLL